MKCADCAAYVEEKQYCYRYPAVVEKKPDDWCLEFKAREVILCPVEEEKERREEEEKVDDIFERAKRGWPKGKPRK